MKKCCMSVLALFTLFSLGACSNETPNEGNQNETVQTWKDQLISDDEIVIGISPDYPPFEYLTTTGEIEGFDIDMANALMEYFSSEGDMTLTWEKMEFSNIVSSVQLGTIDMGISGFTYDPDRQVLFSDPYMDSAQVIMVAPNSQINKAEDLDGKIVGVQLGSTGEKAAQENLANATIQSGAEVPLLVEALKSGAIDAVVVDEAVAKNYANEGVVKILDQALVDESTSIIVKQGNDLLVEKVNEAIASFKESPAYEELKTKWGL